LETGLRIQGDCEEKETEMNRVARGLVPRKKQDERISDDFLLSQV
jgi:hypothetical protein